MTASLILVCDAIGSRHQFGPSGGAFGRSRKCDWVLPDPERHLSSVHARILYQNDTFVLVDESTNGTFLEGQPAAIGRGKAVSLSVGMKLLAGPYQIRVESVASSETANTNPFSTTAPNSANRAPTTATPLRIDTSGASLPQNTSLDPLDHLGGAPETLTPVATAQTTPTVIPEPVAFSAPAAPASPHETTRFQSAPPTSSPAAAPPVMPSGQMPSQMPTQTSAPAEPNPATHAPTTTQIVAAPAAPALPETPQPAAAVPVQPQSGAAVIPEDFLAGIGAPSPAASPSPGGQQSQGLPDLSGLMPSPTDGADQSGAPASSSTIPDNIDFGLGGAAPVTQGPSTSAPAAQASTQAFVPAASTAASIAPANPAAPAASPVSPPDAASATSGAALNPLDALKKRRAQREAELAQKAKSRAESPRSAGKPAPIPPATTPIMPATQHMPAAIPASVVPAAPKVPASEPASEPASAARMPAAKAPGDKGPAAANTLTATRGAGQISPEVFEALLAGLGFADADVPVEERSEIARASGEMVRELANGLITLLKARKSLKTEFRMHETRIQPEENNPFKHFDVGELAIDEMLFARKGGFLPPPEAAKEAFKDLQSHTMLTVAATQRAMRLLFESLSPEALAGEEDDGGLRIRGLGSKRGKFEAAKERHDRMRADFDAVVRQTIAEAFVQVEEEQARQQSKSFWENRKK